MQCNMGAKNHGVVMADANKAHTLNQLVGAAFGAAGQRCMALSTAVFVGEANSWLTELKERAEKLKVNAGQCVYSEVVTGSFLLPDKQSCSFIFIRLYPSRDIHINWGSL